MVGLYVLVAVLVVASAFGVYRRLTDGRIRSLPPQPAEAPSPADRLTPEDLGTPLGERATLVQFSTAFCQPCRATRRILDDVARMVDGVGHVEIDAESHLDLVRRLDVRRTPTVLVLDADGQVRNRATGAPRKAEVLAVLGGLTGDARPAE
jgi:thiol-disulfide isomerase/thioredoxin